jgi:peptidoglycan hydrolase-like protein with peptidoglycan-binding domain
MKRFFLICALSMCAAAAGLAQDTDIATVQQKLKDGGFYYGEVTGRNDADTTAAIRRYQIRNGLKVTGTLDAETRKSLGVRGGGSAATPAPRATPLPQRQPTPVPQPRPTDDYVDDLRDNEPVAPAPRQTVPEFDDELEPEIEAEGLFDGTPYQAAPPEVQLQVVAGAQTMLARQGLYRSGIDGVFGPGTAAALRAFQSGAGLYVTGRLDMETLAALGLLPRQRPAFGPRRRIFRPPVIYSPRGERIYIPR